MQPLKNALAQMPEDTDDLDIVFHLSYWLKGQEDAGSQRAGAALGRVYRRGKNAQEALKALLKER